MAKSTASLAVVFLLALFQAPVYGQNTGPFAPEEQREHDPGTMSENLYRQLEGIHELIGNEQYAEAEAESRDLLDEAGNDYETAVVAQTLGHTLAAQEQYSEAIRYFEQAIQVNALPDPTHYGMMYNIAHLYVATERYEQALTWLNRYFDLVTEPNLNAYVLAASIYGQLERYEEAIEAITYAIEHDEGEPSETWYQVLLSFRFELKQWEQAAQLLQTMIEFWPGDSDYWTQLASIYMQLKQDKEALAVLAAAKKENLLEGETAWLQLVNLYMYLEIPYYGAQVLAEGLERGIIERDLDNLELLANAWFAAHEKEKAIEAYAAAGELSDDGEMDMRRAYLLVEMEDWERATEALQTALDKGGLGNETGDAYVLLGMARYETGNVEGAKNAFRAAMDYDDNRRAAVQWLNFIEDEAAKEQAQAESAATSS